LAPAGEWLGEQVSDYFGKWKRMHWSLN